MESGDIAAVGAMVWICGGQNRSSSQDSGPKAVLLQDVAKESTQVISGIRGNPSKSLVKLPLMIHQHLTQPGALWVDLTEDNEQKKKKTSKVKPWARYQGVLSANVYLKGSSTRLTPLPLPPYPPTNPSDVHKLLMFYRNGSEIVL